MTGPWVLRPSFHPKKLAGLMDCVCIVYCCLWIIVGFINAYFVRTTVLIAFVLLLTVCVLIDSEGVLLQSPITSGETAKNGC